MGMRSKKFLITSMATLFGIVVFLIGVEVALSGEVIKDEIFSPSLEGNLLGDSATRPINIYLPPSYNVENSRYPVVYYLHCYTCNESTWVGCNIQAAMDELIAQGEVQEMIIVMPNAQNKYNGSWYSNSSVAGNYEDYITEDLVEFIDGKYRTLPQRESRAVAGGSMGGFGAMYLAIKYPDVYCAAVSHSGPLSFNVIRGFLHSLRNDRMFQAMAIAFSPNPDAELLYDYPTDNAGSLQDDIWQRWLEHEPTGLVSTHQENLEQLAEIYFDHGTVDSVAPISMSRDFDRALTEAGIPHVYEEYVGDHSDSGHYASILLCPSYPI
jgi:S-formylglutathione hydrolase